MTSSKLPVVAVIPNYNMAENLLKLLPQVLAQNYLEIYVIDDASTDNSAEIISSFNKVKMITGKTNVGPGANRNRIIQEIPYDAILHFVDADVTLISQNNAEAAQKLFENQTTGIVGGLVVLPDGKQMLYNHGPRYSLYSVAGGSLQYFLSGSNLARKNLHYFLKEYPDINKKPHRQKVFWVSEANMLIPSELFKKVGGFNIKLRYHEIQDLSINIHKEGYETYFDPGISVEHPHLNWHDRQKKKTMRRAARHLVRQHGLPIK